MNRGMQAASRNRKRLENELYSTGSRRNEVLLTSAV